LLPYKIGSSFEKHCKKIKYKYKKHTGPKYTPEMHLLEKRRVKLAINWTLLFHKYLA